MKHIDTICAAVMKMRKHGYELEPGPFVTVAEVESAARGRRRSHFFSPPTMEVFDTKVDRTRIYAGVAFVYSDRTFDGLGRDYKIGFIDAEHNVHVLSLDPWLPSLEIAREVATALEAFLLEEERLLEETVARL